MEHLYAPARIFVGAETRVACAWVALATVGMESIITTHLLHVRTDRIYPLGSNDSGNHVQVGQLLYPRNR